jgi:hypothetical protein
MMLKSLLIALFLSTIVIGGAAAQPAGRGVMASTPASSLRPQVATEWMQLLYDRIREEGISAPAASRLYAYAGVTLYESILPGMPENLTLANQVNDFPVLPWVQEDDIHDWTIVANAAMSTVMTGLFYDQSEASAQAFASFRQRWVDRQDNTPPDVVERSLAYGDLAGERILAWALRDDYRETRGLSYTPPVGPEFWVPTAAEAASIEPHWGELRPFILDHADECAFPRDYPFSTETTSTFYAQAKETYEVGRNLTPEQREIARFWLDTPGETGTPSGHWVLIQMELVRLLNMSLNRAVEMFVKTNIALADSFISAWRLKYQDVLLRPETYINAYIDPRWSPYIATPNFPEYPSGHSVTSGAAAEVLQSMFGQVAFTSVTFPGGRRMQRSFTSFMHAATEAAISRIYGGIHFRAAIENGLEQGECIGEIAMERITLRSIAQGE